MKLTDLIKNKIDKAIGQSYPHLEIELEQKNVSTFGDFSTNIAFTLAKQSGKKPIEIAQEIKLKLEKEKDIFEKVETAGGGFVNLFLNKNFIIDSFWKEIGENTNINIGKNKKVIIEFSSPNVAKPMHVGHLRGTILGDFLSNLYEATGFKVIRWNHVGDWGTQFGKLIVAYKKWGDKKKVEESPIKELLSLYVKFHDQAKDNPELEDQARQEFKKLENEDKENTKLLEWFLKESLKEFEKTYKLLDIKFDVSIGESFYTKDNKKILEELKSKGIAKKSQGAWIIEFENMPPALVEKSDGSSLYLTRDLASLKYRIAKYNPSKIIYVVGNEQSLHFNQLFAVAKILRINQSELEHVKIGMILKESGKKLSTREGGAASAQELIDESIKTALDTASEKRDDLSQKEKEKIAQAVGISALKYNLLKDYRESDIVFDPKKALSLQGNSGPYIQYTYARLSSILSKAGKISKIKKPEFGGKEIEIIKKISLFKDVLEKCIKDSSSHHLTEYIFELANLANNFYESNPILSDTNETRKNSRLVLIKEINKVIESGFSILGIKVLNRI